MGVLQDAYDTLVPEGSTGRGVDAAVLRQFDDVSGGGLFDADTYNPFNNTQTSGDTDIPGTDVDVGEGGSGVGWQPGQSIDDDTYGFGPNDDGTDDEFLRRLEGMLAVLVTVVAVGAGAYLLGPFVELLTVVVDDG